jgi:hypothetical protein
VKLGTQFVVLATGVRRRLRQKLEELGRKRERELNGLAGAAQLE